MDSDFIEKTMIEARPEIWQRMYPRRIVPPSGYVNPKVYSISTTASTYLWGMGNMDLGVHQTMRMHSLLLFVRSAPVYFVTEEFIQDVLETEPPEGIRFTDLPFPVPSAIFALPVAFVMRFFKRMIPFMSYSVAPRGEYPKDVLSKEDEKIWVGDIRLQTTVDKICMHGVDCSEDLGVPADYGATALLTDRISDVAHMPFHDATFYERALIGIPPGKSQTELDKELLGKLTTLLTKLILVLSTAPSFMRPGSLQRPARIKRGRLTREALWSPNMVGYAPERKTGHESQNGESKMSRSPRIHWRRRHFTHQVYGPKDAFVPLSALPRTEEGKVNWAATDPDLVTRFWKCHKLVWVERQLVGAAP